MTPLLWLPRLALLSLTGCVLILGLGLCRLLWDAWIGITRRRSERAEQTLRQASLTNVLAAEVLAQITKQRVTIDAQRGFAEVTARNDEECAEIISQSPFFLPTHWLRGQP